MSSGMVMASIYAEVYTLFQLIQIIELILNVTWLFGSFGVDLIAVVAIVSVFGLLVGCLVASIIIEIIQLQLFIRLKLN